MDVLNVSTHKDDDYSTDYSFSELNASIKNKRNNRRNQRMKYKMLWERIVMKLRKDSGKSYETSSSKESPSKVFRSVNECCMKARFKNVSVPQQSAFFNSI